MLKQRKFRIEDKQVFHSKIKNKILLIRGHRVMLAPDLAEMYGVETKALNQAVRRNKERFPAEFMFRLAKEEKEEVVANCDHLRALKFTPYPPYAFTEHGALMLANVLNSKRAISVSIFLIRAFIKLRDLGYVHHVLSLKLDELEKHVKIHDKKIRLLFEAIRQLMKEPESPRNLI